MTKAKLHFQRFEFKYYLPKNKADKLIPALLGHMEWDPYILESDEDFYRVNSLYFDSPGFDCFWDKESGVSNRKKLRFRFYSNNIDESTPIFAEIRRKKDSLVIKDRISLDAVDCFNSNFDSKLNSLVRKDSGNDFLKELVWFKKKNSMKPRLFVSYKRKALAGKDNKRFRVTFDYDIQTQLLNDLSQLPNHLKDVYPEGVVLEVKYNNVMPAWFHKIIQGYQLERLAYSKYCNSLRHVIPQLDDNNYSII
jgi:hypothetical protein